MQERTPEETETEEGVDKKALMEELEQLGKLYQSGVFSQAEFEAQRAELLEQLRVLRSGQTPMPSKGGGSGLSQVHGTDVLATGFVGGQGQVGLGVGRVVGERCRLLRMLGRGGMGEITRPLTPAPSPRDATLRGRGESKHAGASGVSVPSLRSEPSFATAWRGVPQSDG